MATDSGWGYATRELVNPEVPVTPGAGVLDSGWGFATVTLTDPAPPTGGGTGEVTDSRWAFATVTLATPHAPVGVVVAGGDVERVAPVTFDGSLWR